MPVENKHQILITGGNGYIAKSLYNSFKDKYHAVSIARQDFDLTNSFETLKYFSNKYFDAVIHCAVSGGSRLKQETWSDMDSNIKMYYNLLNCKDKFGKLIHFGSGAETNAPESPYGLSKRVIANSISEQKNFYNIKIFGVFDENELPTRFLKANILRYINRQPIEIHENKRMDFFYMKDLTTLVDHFLTQEESEKNVFCSYEQSYFLSELAQKINDLDSHKVEIINANKQGADYNASQQENGKFAFEFIKCIGIENGIKMTHQKLKSQYAKIHYADNESR